MNLYGMQSRQLVCRISCKEKGRASVGSRAWRTKNSTRISADVSIWIQRNGNNNNNQIGRNGQSSAHQPTDTRHSRRVKRVESSGNCTTRAFDESKKDGGRRSIQYILKWPNYGDENKKIEGTRQTRLMLLDFQILFSSRIDIFIHRSALGTLMAACQIIGDNHNMTIRTASSRTIPGRNRTRSLLNI